MCSSEEEEEFACLEEWCSRMSTWINALIPFQVQRTLENWTGTRKRSATSTWWVLLGYSINVSPIPINPRFITTVNSTIPKQSQKTTEEANKSPTNYKNEIIPKLSLNFQIDMEIPSTKLSTHDLCLGHENCPAETDGVVFGLSSF